MKREKELKTSRGRAFIWKMLDDKSGSDLKLGSRRLLGIKY
jgi:hypothetical protein